MQFRRIAFTWQGVVNWTRRERLAIVDYEGEREGTGHVLFDVDLHMFNGVLLILINYN